MTLIQTCYKHCRITSVIYTPVYYAHLVAWLPNEQNSTRATGHLVIRSPKKAQMAGQLFYDFSSLSNAKDNDSYILLFFIL
ncbi:unnamed protein product [Rhizophagus irregularis]|nr:unnamed protein product [Rhizophagus irregularis]